MGLWLRGKHDMGRWAAWDFDPHLQLDYLLRARKAVRDRFSAYVKKCVDQGEQLVKPHSSSDLTCPLGFTPNDFVRQTIRDLVASKELPAEIKVDIFNIRWFFQTIQVSESSYEEGPQPPVRRLPNELRKKG